MPSPSIICLALHSIFQLNTQASTFLSIQFNFSMNSNSFVSRSRIVHRPSHACKWYMSNMYIQYTRYRTIFNCIRRCFFYFFFVFPRSRIHQLVFSWIRKKKSRQCEVEALLSIMLGMGRFGRCICGVYFIIWSRCAAGTSWLGSPRPKLETNTCEGS